MRCPSCAHTKTRVTKTSEDRRWRVCECGRRFETVEVLVGREPPPKKVTKPARVRPAERGQPEQLARHRIEDRRIARELGLMMDDDDTEGMRE